MAPDEKDRPAGSTDASMTAMMASDSRIHFDQTTQKWCFEADDGTEMEWDTLRHAWVPVLEDELVHKQQAAYSVQGTPAAPVIARENKRRKKDKDANHQEADVDETLASTDADSSLDPSTSSSSSASAPTATAAAVSKNKTNNKSHDSSKSSRAVFVSQLPLTATVDQIKSVFSKAGLIMEDADGEPRIKMYKDDKGLFKGEALVVYLQEASVDLATRLLDETELELGSGQGVMKVKKAEWSKDQQQQQQTVDEAGNSARTRQGAGENDQQRRQRQKKRTEKLRQKLTDWSSSDDEATAQLKARARLNPKVVVLQGMFTLAELEEDPALLLDLKEDVREECETLGEVTNVNLYDKEPTGILTVRFKDELAAKACIAKMNGRYFGGRQVRAYYLDTAQKYKKSGQGVDLAGTGLGDEHEERREHEQEEERLRKYAEWLEKGGDNGETDAGGHTA
ncbi:hypothetical protein OIV83_005372 [Microbotryomycetes sp. JL201]|nr:hypothetical protein OIV83_005372 [Microbotryomycetes sp. JL201]